MCGSVYTNHLTITRNNPHHGNHEVHDEDMDVGPVPLSQNKQEHHPYLWGGGGVGGECGPETHKSDQYNNSMSFTACHLVATCVYIIPIKGD